MEDPAKARLRFPNLMDMMITERYGAIRKKTFYAMVKRVKKGRKLQRQHKRAARARA